MRRCTPHNRFAINHEAVALALTSALSRCARPRFATQLCGRAQRDRALVSATVARAAHWFVIVKALVTVANTIDILFLFQFSNLISYHISKWV